MKAFITFLILGFPFALVLAWTFDIERTDSSARSKTTPTAREDASQPAGREYLDAPPSPDSAVASVAVLPFENLSQNPEHTFLADGIATDLHSALSGVHRLRVASRKSSFAFRGYSTDVRVIARKLNVRYILYGSLRRVGDHMRVVAELDNAEEGVQLWSETYNREVNDVFAVQNDIALAIASAFGGERLREEISSATGRPTRNLDAWSLVQRARSYILGYSPQALADAIPLLRSAVELDAEYAAAHAALGSVFAERVLNGLSTEPAADRDAALEAAAHAFTLSPLDPFVLKMCGSVWAYFGQAAKSVVALRQAVKIAPFDFGAWGYMGWPLVETGVQQDLDDLHNILDRILRVAPNHPGVPYWSYHQSVAYTCERRDALAVELAAKSVERNPGISWAWMQYANALGHTGAAEQAKQTIARGAEINPALTPGHFESLVRGMSATGEVSEKRLGGLRAARILN